MAFNRIDDDNEKADLLFLLGGPELDRQYQKVVKIEKHRTATTDGNPEAIILLKYDTAIASLDAYFAPQLNKRFERHNLRAIKQEQDELFVDFVNRLREQAARCDFKDEEDAVIDQIIEGCGSTDLRKKLLTDDKSLVEVMNLGKSLEKVQDQTKAYEKKHNFELVQRIERNTTNSRCHACGREGHYARDKDKCPAANFRCHSCGQQGHFKVNCQKRKRNFDNGPPVKRFKSERKLINRITTSNEIEDTFVMLVGNVEIDLLVDSGSAANIVTEKTFRRLQTMQAELKNVKTPDASDQKYQAYGSENDIDFVATFEAEVKKPKTTESVWAIFLVARKGQTNLLSKAAAYALGMLKIGYAVNRIVESKKMESKFPKVPNVQIKIHVDPNVKPVAQPLRRLPLALDKEVEEMIQKMREDGIIEEDHEPSGWVSPVVPARKANGELRLCVDLRAANEAVMLEHYPMPNIEVALMEIGPANMFSIIDLVSAYYHLELEPSSQDITKFIVRSGIYKYLRLPFGIKSAPEIFQRFLATALRKVKNVIVYLDDILVYAKDKTEHDRTLTEVMTTLKELNLQVNQKKSIFGKESVEFLGFQISKNGVDLTGKKVKAFLDLRSPQTTAELQSLLGTLTFFGKFLPNLSQHTEKMRKLTEKGRKFEWTSHHEEEFKRMKYYVKQSPTLRFFDINDESYLVTDAGPNGIGAVMMQLNQEDLKPVMFISRTLAPHEKNFCQTEKECLAIIWAMKRLKTYLYGKKFKLITDCKPLKFLFEKKQSKPSGRLER